MTTATHLHFPDLTTDTAPKSVRPTLEKMQRQFGGAVPPAAARMANSPELLTAFLTTSSMFERCSLTPLQRETLIMTVAVRNGCDVCIDMHTATLQRLTTDERTIATLRDGAEVDEPKLAALQRFTHQVMNSAGAVTDDQLAAFAAHGFGPQQALEVLLGVGTYTLSTFANRMTRA